LTIRCAARSRFLAVPSSFPELGGNATLPLPVKGQHTKEELRKLGYTEKEIADMADQKVITV
jgi:crotonobetainyl-CoA:carnitine CoA-transferase CaiB-like acyl-CoA transferase